MADTSPPAGLLDRAHQVFLLAYELGRAFHQENVRQGERMGPIDPAGWKRRQPAFGTFCAAVLDLRDAMQHPPEGFAPVAQALRGAARVAQQIRDVMQTDEGWRWAAYRNFFPELHAVAAAGREALQEVARARRPEDPFAFLDQPGANPLPGIDTTPALPRPPQALVEAAARDLPVLLANVQPEPDGTIELVAAHLAKRLQDAKHTLAAAQWAIHQGVRAGWLRPGRVEVGVPLVLRPGRRARSDDGLGPVPLPQGKPAPYDAFTVAATEALWAEWRSAQARAATRANPTHDEQICTFPGKPNCPIEDRINQ